MRETKHATVSKRNPASLFALLGCALLAIFVANVCLGSAVIPLGDVWRALIGSDGGNLIMEKIVVDIRLPRATTALFAGAALSVSGLLMQTIFRNPLADPFVLGVNSGASLGVAIVLLVLAPGGVALTQNLAFSGHVLVVFASSAGAAAVLLVVMLFAQRVDVMSLLILGLMMSYAVGSVVSILMFYSMAERVQSFFSWSYGSFANVTWTQMKIFASCLLSGMASVFFLSKPLDAMLLGEGFAASLGTRVKSTRVLTLGLASLLAGTVTGFCGPIGFLGIAAPHLCRYLFRTSEHRILIPASLMAGSIIALAADLAAKGPGFDGSLPLNAVTALIGSPVIIVALLRQRNLKKAFG
ncbi:iron ABC transporter permease [Pelagicoccus sp. SDUM812003]|uniref:FecCD family ABC transporter permease n=1 Tax=Pelagicoccus sp. SDUM812003 TaxID=3041267 RepID=UPI00280F9565|nr:iron ABC transporter permease [Pelagicoccus sp. SDUM812003]MDQ8203138.1 iron ABC transporter permease [Pelagicoccus sp. SDUM812003]